MNCDCQQAKTLIALWAGHDLPSSEERSLQRHVALCPGCKAYARDMKICMKQLQECSGPRLMPSDKCLWSSLKTTLQAPGHPKQVRRFNGWTASLAMAACFLAMFSIHQTMNQNRPQDLSNTAEASFFGRNLQYPANHPLPGHKPDDQSEPGPGSDFLEQYGRGIMPPFQGDMFPLHNSGFD